VIFAAVILGGIGKPYGAMLGALIIGLATEMSAVVFNAAYKLDVAFVLLVIVLLVRPQGLLAVRGRA
jgi:branched-chain amino acid transport system permease protein